MHQTSQLDPMGQNRSVDSHTVLTMVWPTRAYPETLQSVKAAKMLASSWSLVLGGRWAHDAGAPLQMESSLVRKAESFGLRNSSGAC